ncbi:iron transporter [Pseudomonas gingeri]|uniref:Iron transporter n=2 Tax=Pseudomonas gingeri TaxID=117681 RepID=A0A7Y7YDT2_9PSED|nr:iron transporter [Pseudomonas gingeri]NWA14145.1 iron transporter [Pseudomonas gingeri]NWA55237.1 iron transporter [Pseudomonas gingeri]NWA94961.1 iron transporter [Pseudomonas gingeri]NWB01617.1 iron transporter [Pseudomonas gingeri]
MKSSFNVLALALAGVGALTFAAGAQAREFPIGGPVQTHDMEIASSYLVGIDMAPMPPGMVMGADSVHLETDVHATADNKYGFANGEWIPYLRISYLLVKQGSPDYKEIGTLLPMVAKDGAHYANNVKMDGPGTYTVVLRYESPQVNGFFHHIDKETGVPEWWGPFSETFTFKYPQK